MFKIRTGHAVTAQELFAGWDRKKKLRVNSSIFGQTTLRLCALVFSYCIYLIIRDIIENKVSFKLPNNNAFLEMTPIKGDLFKKLMGKGWFEGLDYLASNFIAYMLLYRDESGKKGGLKKILYTDGKLKQEIIERTNNGEKW